MRWCALLMCLSAQIGSLGVGCAPEIEPPSAPNVGFTHAAPMPAVDLSARERTVPTKLADEPLWTVEGTSTPVVVGDLVVGRFGVAGTSQWRFQAVDGRSGRPRWWTQLPEARSAGLSRETELPQVRVEGDRATAYVATESTNQDDETRAYLVAIDVVDGRARWTVPVGDVVGEGDRSLFGITRHDASARLIPGKVPPPSPNTTVLQTRSAVLVGWSTSHQDERGPTTYAFDPATGRPLWKRAGLPKTAGVDQVVLEQRLPGDESDRHGFVAVDPRRGVPRWTEERYSEVVASPDANSVLLTERHGGTSPEAPTSLRTAEGAPLGELDAEVDECRPGGGSYVCLQSSDTSVGAIEVFAINATTGRERWRVRPDEIGLAGAVEIAAVEASHVSLLPAGDGPGTVLDPRTGRVLEHISEPVPIQLGNDFALGQVRRNGASALGSYGQQG